MRAVAFGIRAFTFALLFGLLGCHGTAAPVSRPTVIEGPREYTYAQIEGVPLKLFVFSPAPGSRSRPAAMLFFHGGGWSAGSPEWTFNTARRFASLGMVSVSVQYRLSKDGATPIEALADACAAFRWVRSHASELGIDPSRVAGHGVSAGGQLVAATATVGCPTVQDSKVSSVPDALLLWSPAVDVENDNWFGKLLGGRATSADYSPLAHVGTGVPPTVIVNGEKDSLTPVSGAKRFCERIKDSGGTCTLHIYNGLGHLLSRQLADQENTFDVDSVAREDGLLKLGEFLGELGFLADSRASAGPAR